MPRKINTAGVEGLNGGRGRPFLPQLYRWLRTMNAIG